MKNFATREQVDSPLFFLTQLINTVRLQLLFLPCSLVQIIVELFRVVLPYDVAVRSDRVAFVLPEIMHRRHDGDFWAKFHIRSQSIATHNVT